MSATIDELHWLAFRYVAGELSAAEEERFEQRLAKDQAAREAVEQAAELSNAIRLVAADTAAVPHRDSYRVARRATWVAVTVAGLLLAAFVCWRSLSDPSSDTNSADANAETLVQPLTTSEETDDENASTALAWARLRAANSIEPAEFEAEQWNHAEAELAEANLRAGDRVDKQLPAWLLTAIASEAETKNGDR